MADQTVLIIRHAEKPELGSADGVTEDGVSDSRSLTPRGWQRAGAWAALLVPTLGSPSPLPTPATIFASAPSGRHDVHDAAVGSKSRRPLETVGPLSAKIGVEPNVTFGKGQEGLLATAVSGMDGVILICWQHEDILNIARALAPNATLPAEWPGTCFNVMFRFDRASQGADYSFSQLVPVLLEGDTSATL